LWPACNAFGRMVPAGPGWPKVAAHDQGVVPVHLLPGRDEQAAAAACVLRS
jgi:hypothetical protein